MSKAFLCFDSYNGAADNEPANKRDEWDLRTDLLDASPHPRVFTSYAEFRRSRPVMFRNDPDAAMRQWEDERWERAKALGA